MNPVDDFLSHVPAPERAALQRIRNLAHEVAPEAIEGIGYGMPVLRYRDKYLVGFCAFKAHMSLFPGALPLDEFKKRLTGYKVSKGTVQFTLEHPLPDDLTRDIIRLRKEAIEAR